MRCPRAADKWWSPGRDAAAVVIIIARRRVSPKANFFLAEAAGACRDKNKERA
jgi:hypothetical protein